MSILDDWIAESAENKTLLEEETLILEVAEQFWEHINEQDISKAELARRMGISKARVGKMLDGSNNLTLRKIANMATALNMKFKVRLEAETDDQWQDAQIEIVPSASSNVIRFPKTSFQKWNDEIAISL